VNEVRSGGPHSIDRNLCSVLSPAAANGSRLRIWLAYKLSRYTGYYCMEKINNKLHCYTDDYKQRNRKMSQM